MSQYDVRMSDRDLYGAGAEVRTEEMVFQKEYPMHGSELTWPVDSGLEDSLTEVMEALDFHIQVIKWLKAGAKADAKPKMRSFDNLPIGHRAAMGKIMDSETEPMDAVLWIIVKDLTTVLDFFVKQLKATAVARECPSTSDVRAIFDVISACFAELDDLKAFQNKIVKMCAQFGCDSPFTTACIAMLSEVFNRVEQNAEKSMTLDALLKVAASNSDASHSLGGGMLSQVSEWLQIWDTKASVRQNILKNAYEICRSNKEEKLAFDFLLEYLNSFESSAAASSEVVELAADAVVSVVSDTQVNARPLMDVWKAAAVRKLKDSSLEKHKNLYELLRIQYQGTVADFVAFDAKKKGVVSQVTSGGLTADELLPKMRVLTLCSMGASTVSLTELRDCLRVDSIDAAEKVLIEAVMDGFVEAKIDHLTQTLSIESCTQRGFDGKTAWKKLHEKLSLWTQNTTTVLQVIRANTTGFGSSFATSESAF